MGKARKSTKKFVATQLKGVMDKRHERKRMQGKLNKKTENKQVQKAVNVARGPRDPTLAPKPGKRVSNTKKNIEDMDMEEFMNMEGDVDDEIIDIDDEASDAGSDAEDDFDPDDADSALESMEDGEDDEDVAVGHVDDEDEDEDEDEIAAHKDELEKLQEQDPEFFKYLKQHDKRLLDFGQNMAEDDDDDEEEDHDEKRDGEDDDEVQVASDGESDDSDAHRRKRVVSRKHLTLKQVDSWEETLASSETSASVSTQVLKKLLLAFRSACHLSDVNKVDGMKHAYRIETGLLYNRILVACMRTVPIVLYRLAGGNAADLERVPTPLPKALKGWKRTEIFAKSYLGNLLHLLPSLSSSSMLLYALRHLLPAMPLVASFTMYARKMLKLFLGWLTHTDEHVALRAFLALRSLAVTSPPPFLMVAMKGVYMTAVRASRSVNYITLPRITFLTQCVVDLFGAEHVAAYQLAFVYIRQCAIHLRNAMQTPSKEAYASVYNWQFVQSLRILSTILSTHVGSSRGNDEHPFRPLVFPLVQVITGTIRLVPTPRFYPLRFACVRMLNTISRATGYFIPVLPFLLEAHAHFSAPSSVKGSAPGKGKEDGSLAAQKAADLTCLLRVSKTTVRQRGFAESCLAECMELFAEHFSTLARSIAFPEMTFLANVALKKHIKDTRNIRLKKNVQVLLEKLADTAKIVVAKRDIANIAPKDVERAIGFGELLGDKTELPIERFYRMEKERRDKERREIAAAATQDMFAEQDEGADMDAGADSDEDDSEDAGNSGKRVRDEQDEVEELENENDEKPTAKKAKAGKPNKSKGKAKKAAQPSDSEDGSEDEVGAFDMSEFV